MSAQGLPLSILCHSLHSPSPLGWASPNSVFPPLSFKDYCLFPLAFAWWLPFREMRTRLRVRNTFIMYALELQGWFTAQLPLVEIHPQCSAYPPQGKEKRYIPITFIIKSVNTLICDMWQQRRCRNKVTGPSKPQKAFQLIPFIFQREPTHRIWGGKSKKFSSLLGRFGVGQGEGRRKKQHVKISPFPTVQDQEHGRTDKLATLPYLLFRFQEL